MVAVETAVIATCTLLSGCALAVVGYVRSLAQDARKALRLLVGEENVDDDGLIDRVAQLEAAVRDVLKLAERNQARIEAIADAEETNTNT